MQFEKIVILPVEMTGLALDPIGYIIFPWIYRREVIEDVSFSFEAVKNQNLEMGWQFGGRPVDMFWWIRKCGPKPWENGMSNDVLKQVGEISTT